MKKLNSKTLQNELADVSKKIDLATSNIEINEQIEHLLTSLLDAEFASLWYYNKRDMSLLRERGNVFVRTLSLEEKRGILYKCFMTKEAKIYNYLASDKDYVAAIDNPDNIKIRSKVIVPLVYDDNFLGIVTVYSSVKKAKKFTKEDIKKLQALSTYLIDIISKMHQCNNKNCSCKKVKQKEAENIAFEEMQRLEASPHKQSRSEKAIDNSIANFIHDMRTPANTLQGFLELLENQITDKRLKEYIINAKESASFINELTTEMLDRISLQREQDSSQLKEIESVKFFANIAEMFVSNMYEKKINFNVYIDPMLPKTIEVDELKLKRVVMNLIGNAYKFTPYGKSIELAIKYNKESQSATIHVKDTGIGIAKEKQKEIFEAFKQAEESTSLHYGGTGLGLSICAGYVAEFGGVLELESEVDKGSRFFFTLPMKIIDETDSFEAVENRDIKIAVLMSSRNSFSLLNIARYFVRMGIDKNNIIAISSVSEIPKDVTHLVVYQHKLDDGIEDNIAKNTKVLIVEEELFSINMDDLDENYNVIPQYGYFSETLYQFINSRKVPKALIVDDDKISILLLERILENEYCEVEVATNGKVALEMIIDSYKKETPYTVIYIDNNMPLMSGLEVMRHVREFERDNKLKPIYAVSTSGNLLDLKAEGKDFNEYVGKPFRVTEIRKFLYH
ncbi:two-component hybrid sensor and regulator [hydrothermal vent metagenome]|uniref:histidine kinase n=1 Tax=hydrothermal vent metagenome TaxID=652676 RepID=A0A1W1BQ65_9ZZZZ